MNSNAGHFCIHRQLHVLEHLGWDAGNLGEAGRRASQQHLAADAEVDGRVHGHTNGYGHHPQRQQPHEDGAVGVVAAPVLMPVTADACAEAPPVSAPHWSGTSCALAIGWHHQLELMLVHTEEQHPVRAERRTDNRLTI